MLLAFFQNFPKGEKLYLAKELGFFNGPVVICTVTSFMQLLLKSGIIPKLYN